jgi:hypothetical protein
MAHRLTCPHCEAALRVADNASAAVVTCPRCLGQIPSLLGAGSGANVMGISVEDKARRVKERAGWGHRRHAQAGCLLAILVLVGIPFVLARVLVASEFGEAAGGYRYLHWFGIGVSGLNALLFMGLVFLRNGWCVDEEGLSWPRNSFLRAVAVSFAWLGAGLVLFFMTFCCFTFGLAVDQ